VLCEAIGNQTPILMVPMVKKSLWRHPAWTNHLDTLAAAGVLFLDPATGDERAAPVESGTGALLTEHFDPRWVVTAVRKRLNHS
jgi:phosphopantothenoylcysteine synthetase/decarboxylase